MHAKYLKAYEYTLRRLTLEILHGKMFENAVVWPILQINTPSAMRVVDPWRGRREEEATHLEFTVKLMISSKFH